MRTRFLYPPSITHRVLQVLSGLQHSRKILRLRAARMAARCVHGEAHAIYINLLVALQTESDPDVLVLQLQAIRRIRSHTPGAVIHRTTLWLTAIRLTLTDNAVLRQAASVCLESIRIVRR